MSGENIQGTQALYSIYSKIKDWSSQPSPSLQVQLGALRNLPHTASMASLPAWARNAASNVTLDAAGLIALAELKTIPRRTALTGSASLCDTLILCPGVHRQQTATTLNGGENPITANMTSGYVFRIENPATVAYLQSVGMTGHLTTLEVREDMHRFRKFRLFFYLPGPFLANVFYSAAAVLTLFSLVFLIILHDFWLLTLFLLLMLARFLNVIVTRRRCDAEWHGASEPGNGQLLVLLSQDRWIQIKGRTDDLKAVTSGEWLREMTFIEEALEGCAIVIVYLCAALASNGTQVGKFLIIILFLVNAGLLKLSNGSMDSLHMKDRVLKTTGRPKKYKRRLHLAHELIEASGRKDWAIKMGMIVENPVNTDDKKERNEDVEVQV